MGVLEKNVCTATTSGSDSSNPNATVDKVASTLGSIAAAVVGYYFGQRPVRALAEQVQDVATSRDIANQGVQTSLNATEKSFILKRKRNNQLPSSACDLD